MAQARLPETPSPLCDDLLNGLHGFAQGQVTAAEIERVAEIVRGKMRETRRDTFARIESQGAEHEKLYAAQIDGLRFSFDLMGKALDSLVAHTREPSAASFEQADSLLRQAAFAGQYSADWYMRSELEQGPTRMPVVNLLFKLCEGLKAGTVQETNYQAAIKGAQRMMESAAAELSQAPQQNPALQELRSAYVAHQLALEGLAQEPRSKAALQAVATTGEGVREALDSLNQAALVEGPSRLARTNILLHHVEAHAQGQSSHETLKAALESFQQDLDEERQEVERLSALPTSPKVSRLLAVTREAYRLHEPSLALAAELTQGAPKHADVRQELLEASETLADCREEFEALGETEGKILCVRCSAPNPPGQRTCSRCQAQLPVSGLAGPASTLAVGEDGVSEGDSELEITENLVKLFTAINQVAEGRIDDEEFGDVLAWLDGLLIENLTELPRLPAFPGVDKLSEEHRAQLAEVELQCQVARDELLEGSQDFREALARMSCYLEDHDKEHLTVGVQAVREAVVKIQTNTRRIEQLAGIAQAAGRAEEG